MDDGYVSGGEWALEPSWQGGPRYQLRNRRNDKLLGADGLGPDEDALAFTIEPAEGCATFPELSLDATGSIARTTFDDGTLYGIAEFDRMRSRQSDHRHGDVCIAVSRRLDTNGRVRVHQELGRFMDLADYVTGFRIADSGT